MKVRALDSFDHNGLRRKDSIFDVSPQHGKLLANKGLVELLEGGSPLAGPTGAALQSSASQVGQASPEETLSESDNGEAEDETPRKSWRKRRGK